MANFIRTSKYRHVFCDTPRADAIFSNLRLSTVTGDQSYIKSNGIYFAVAVQGGGGPFQVVNMDKPGKIPGEAPVIQGHSAAVLDFDFNPFHDQMIASGSEDQTVKVWGIPEGGLTDNITDPLVDLHGHQRKVTMLKFHPTASNVLASVSSDHTVKLWDIEKGQEMTQCTGAHTELINDLSWNWEGDFYATSCKDKNVRIINARDGSVTNTITTAHDGAKSIKTTYLGSTGLLLSCGFTRQSMRQFKIWDPRNTSTHLKQMDVDQAAGVIMPFYDNDTQILYLAGKGDGNIRYYELVGENSSDIFPINDYRSSVSAKGACFVPKTKLNVMKCETARILKLTSNSVDPLVFTVPRKSESFQDDIFPDTAGQTPAHTQDEWFGGSSKGPVMVSLDPSKATSASSTPKALVAVKTAHQLQIELDAANAKIAALEAKLAAAGIA
jgi:coronin-1B/1C/6